MLLNVHSESFRRPDGRWVGMVIFTATGEVLHRTRPLSRKRAAAAADAWIRRAMESGDRRIAERGA